MKHEWELLRPGLARGEWVGIPDGLIMEYSDETDLVLFVYSNRLSDAEMAEMAPGKRFEIAFKDVDGIGFFVVKFGDQPWADCAFTPNLYESTPRFDQQKGRGEASVLHVMLVDSFEGVLKMRRSIVLGKEFSRHFRCWALESLKKNIGERHYNRVVDAVYKEYQDATALSKAADIHWIRTRDENEPDREEHRREKVLE